MRLRGATKSILTWILGPHQDQPISILKTMIPLKGMAIFLVVLAHSVIGMLAAEVSLKPNVALSPVILGIWQVASFPKSIILELCRCAVPLFLFLSGYFIASSPRSWKTIWNGCKKLLIPMITWSLVGWAFSWRKGAGGWDTRQFLSMLLSGQTQLGYFFIILYIQYYVLSKWLVPFMGRRPYCALFLATILQLATLIYDYVYIIAELGTLNGTEWLRTAGPFPEYLFPRFMLSFALGIWAAQSIQRFRKIIVGHFPTVVAMSFLSIVLVVFERGLLFRQAQLKLRLSAFDATCFSWVEWKASLVFWSVAAIFLFFGCFQKRIPMKSLLDTLGKYSFQIFLLHGIVLDLMIRVYYKLGSGIGFYGFAGCALLLVGGLAIPIAIARVIQKHAPAPIRLLLLGA